MTQREAQKLSETRKLLTKLADEARQESTFNHGKMHESCVTAESAVFGVLNVASSYLRDTVADEAIEAYRA